MEYETINKETPEMKQLISGIKGLTNRVRNIAQTHRPLFEGKIYLTGREVCERPVSYTHLTLPTTPYV